jgi:hypothetical protein
MIRQPQYPLLSRFEEPWTHLYLPGSPIADQSRFISKMLTTLLNDVLGGKRNIVAIDRSSVEQGDVSECARPA